MTVSTLGDDTFNKGAHENVQSSHEVSSFLMMRKYWSAIKMRRPIERFIQIEIITIVAAVLFAFFALIKGHYILAFASLYMIVISLISNAMKKWQLMYKTEASKQFVRAVILFFLASYILLRI